MPIFEGDAALHLKKYRKFFVPYLTTGGQKRIPSREGGVEVVVEELATRMAQQGHSVTCYNRGGHHVSGSAFDAEAVSKYKGVRLKTVPTIFYNTVGGVLGGLMYCAVMKVRKRL